MANRNHQQRRNRYDRSERRNPFEQNSGSFLRSTAGKVADYWPLAIIPALLVRFALWYFPQLVMLDPLPRRAAVFAGIATAYLLNSLFTIWFYKVDKRQAEQQLRRIPEFSLHFWELFCGWPGALYAQRKYRHKWKKTSYMVVFWLCVILNLAMAICLVFPDETRPVLEDGLRLLSGIAGNGS